MIRSEIVFVCSKLPKGCWDYVEGIRNLWWRKYFMENINAFLCTSQIDTMLCEMTFYQMHSSLLYVKEEDTVVGVATRHYGLVGPGIESR